MNYDPLAGFMEWLKKEASEKTAKQQELNRKISSDETYYGGFITAKDALFEEALNVCQWDIGKECEDKARGIILLPPPMFGAAVLYRIDENEYCLKVFSFATYEKRFPSWSELKNFCFSWGFLQPPYMKDKNNPVDFAERLKILDTVMSEERVKEDA